MQNILGEKSALGIKSIHFSNRLQNRLLKKNAVLRLEKPNIARILKDDCRLTKTRL